MYFERIIKYLFVLLFFFSFFYEKNSDFHRETTGDILNAITLFLVPHDRFDIEKKNCSHKKYNKKEITRTIYYNNNNNF